MSEEKKKPAKNDKQPSKGELFLNWWKTLPRRIAKPFKDMHYELKKVTWPTKERWLTYSAIVLVFMLFMGVVIGLLDMGASTAVRSLVSATTKSGSAATVVDEAVDAVEDTAEEVTDAAAETAEDAAQAVEDAAKDVENAADEAVESDEKATEGN